MTESARSRTEGADTILHTYVLAFGLAFRDLSAALSKPDELPIDQPFDSISRLHSIDLDFAISQLEDMLKWVNHPVYAVQGQKRVARASERASKARG